MNEKQKKLYLYCLNNFDKIKNIIYHYDNYTYYMNKENILKYYCFISKYVSLLKKCIELNLLKDKFTFDDLLKLHFNKPELSIFDNFDISYLFSDSSNKNLLNYIPFNVNNIKHIQAVQKNFDLFMNRYFYYFSYDNISIKNEVFDLKKYCNIKRILTLFNSHKKNVILYNNGIITSSYFFFFDGENIIHKNYCFQDDTISVDMPNISFKFKDLNYYFKLVDFYSNDILNTSKKFVFSKKEHPVSVNKINTLFSDWSLSNKNISFSKFKNSKCSFFMRSKFYKNAIFIKKTSYFCFKYKNIILYKNILFDYNDDRKVIIKSINNKYNSLEIKIHGLKESSLPIINLYFSFFEDKERLFNKKTNHIVKNLKKHIKNNEDLNKIEKQLFLLYKS